MHTQRSCITRRGTSLIEVMAVIAIIAIVSGALMVAFSRNRQASNLEAAGRQLAADIRTVQNYALSGKMQGSTIPCSYGVVWGTGATEYNVTYKKLAGVDTCGNSNPTTIKTAQLPSGVTFGSGSAITFLLPRADFAVYHSSITLKAGSLTKLICIYRNGKILDNQDSCPAS
jgi:prepilin-type N-terminal cleavage/methylation domain-containing protein